MPRKPVPQRVDAEPTARTATRDKAAPSEDTGAAEQGTDGFKLERLQVATQDKMPRELRNDGRILEKFGHSDKCP